MKTLITILILIWLFGSNSLAQTNTTGEVFPEQVSIDHNEAVQRFSRDWITMQPGIQAESRGAADVGHSAFISQTGTSNFSKLHQSGETHFADIDLTGNNNLMDMLQQGSGHNLQLELTGDRNTVTGFQRGHNHSIRLRENISDRDLRYEQVGANHTIEFIDTGMPLSIRQTGNGASVIINN